MALICSRCSRVNPGEAQFCFFDGAQLAAGEPGRFRAGRSAANFPSPFVFPSGQACHNYDQLARACIQNWQEARNLLRQGLLGAFLGGLGRSDLAQAAQQAAGFPDPDRGLDQLLGRLPTHHLEGPKLQAEPAEINIGILKVSDQRRFDLHIVNQGMRLLFGQIVSASDWLALGEGQGQAQRLFQCLDQVNVPVQVRGHLLRASPKPLVGKLVIESNGGTLTVRVKAEVPVQPFPSGVLAGATAPRQIAEKARDHPKEAAELFENGAVARWYQANGWTYPVQQPAASGLGAVQQFFEALGLTKPPRVEISETALQLQGRPGEQLQHTLRVTTPDKKPVFAHARSNQPWLVPGKPQHRGATVALPLEITVPDQPGQTVRAKVRVQANGNQRFDVVITVAVGTGGRAAAAALPVLAEVLPEEITEPAAQPFLPRGGPGLSSKPTAELRERPDSAVRAGRPTERDPRPASAPLVELPAGRVRQKPSLWVHLTPALLLVLVLLGVSIRDLWAPERKLQARITEEQEEKKGPKVPEPPKVQIEDEPEEQMRGFTPTGFKVDIRDEPEEPGPGGPGKVKVEIRDEPEEVVPAPGGGTKGGPIDPTLRIFYNYDTVRHWGLVDARTRKRLTYSTTGSTNITVFRVNGQSNVIREGGRFQKLPDDPVHEARERSSYTFLLQPGLQVTQLLEIVPSKQPVDIGGGQQRRLMDTLLVRYLFENTSRRPINSGLRLEVDTLIGGNDGVPFTVPGRGLVNTSADFTTPDQVPDFVQALETGKIQNPGTVVHISLKVGGGIEPPSRVVLCHWATNGDLSNIRPTHMGTDSAVIMVWPDRNLQPGQRREMGYAYGLGSVTVADARGTLGVTLGGNFDIGQSFTITAYVNNPVAGQTLTLGLPPGLDRIKGQPTQSVPAPLVGNTSIVSWEVRVLQTGVFPLKVRSSTGVTQTKTITIARDGPSGGKLKLDLKGNFEPGQSFEVLASVQEPAPGQALLLKLPFGLELEADQERQVLPVPVGGQSQVNWRVRVLRPGRYPVRVESSTGGAQTKTISIDQADNRPGRFFIRCEGEIAPGKVFTIQARVLNPVDGQILSLNLPAGLKLWREPMAQRVSLVPVGGQPLVTWEVMVEKPGKYPVEVSSSTGPRQKKTLTIQEGDGSAGRFTFDLVGDIGLKKEITVVAKVALPVPGQKLTISLPKEMELTGGEKTQAVPPLPGGGQPSTVRWNVVINSGGTRLPIRVESSTGVARTKNLSITGGDGSGQIFR